MSFVWLSDPTFVARYRFDDIKQSCEHALDYFSGLVDQFIAKLPEHRRQQDFQDWMAEERTLAEKIRLIFPHGYGEYDQAKNHNPLIWPVLIELSNAVRDGTTVDFAKELCLAYEETFKENGEYIDQVLLLHRIFDNFTHFLQMFVTFADEESLQPDFLPEKDFDQWWVEVNQRVLRSL